MMALCVKSDIEPEVYDNDDVLPFPDDWVKDDRTKSLSVALLGMVRALGIEEDPKVLELFNLITFGETKSGNPITDFVIGSRDTEFWIDTEFKERSKQIHKVRYIKQYPNGHVVDSDRLGLVLFAEGTFTKVDFDLEILIEAHKNVNYTNK